MTQAPGAITVRARIRLLTTAEGGRQTPVQGETSYRPNHNFFGPDNRDMAVAYIDLPDGEGLALGETREISLTFWPWERLNDEIRPGREWRIQEGGHLVGHGTVIEVLG